MKNKNIAVSILNQNAQEALKKVFSLNLSWIHYDVMDNKFVKNKNLSYKELINLFKNSPPHIKDVHLMVQKPYFLIKKLVQKVDFLSFHIESKINAKKIIEKIKSKKNIFSKIGIAINPDTSIETILPFLNIVDYVLIMSVIPGQGGQKFIQKSFEKINSLRSKNSTILIQVDGGINDENAFKILENGANILVFGSYFFNHFGQKKLIDTVEKIIY